jgi:hypothetical protein
MPKSPAESRIRQARRSKAARGKIHAYLPGTFRQGIRSLIMLRNFLLAHVKGELAAALFTIMVGSLLGTPGCRAAETGLLRLSCVNLVGGARISIVVDLDRHLVDAIPAANFSDKWITWHDPQRGYLDLERATGKLDIRNASSTGGYFLHYQCRPE